MGQALNTQERLHEILDNFDSAMLLTRTSDNRLHARPMAVADLRKDGDLYFATSLQSPKIAEIAANPDVSVTFQNGSQYAAVSGKAQVIRDRALIEQMWSPAWKPWFPQGVNDPSLCLIRVDAQDAEYWDNAGVEGIKYAWEEAKSVMQGRTPATDEKRHARVDLGPSSRH
jgi:general stress protein 26